MERKVKIKWRGLSHPAQAWAKQRHVRAGYRYPATLQVLNKPNGVKPVIIYGNQQLLHLRLLNGNNPVAFRAITRIGAFLFNTSKNRHLIPHLRGLLWWVNNYVPYPLPKGKVAYGENILCDGNSAIVDNEKGKWVHIKSGRAQLNEIVVGSNEISRGTLVWEYSGGWIPKDMVERAN